MMNEHQNGYKNPNANGNNDQELDKQSHPDRTGGFFANLVGLDDDLVDESTQKELVEQTADAKGVEGSKDVSPNNVLTPKELSDDPQLGKTQPTLSTNPFARTGLVGLMLFAVFGSGAMFLSNLMFKNQKTAPNIAKSSPKPEVAINNDVKPEEVETGKLKAELALGSQAEKIKSVEQAKSPKNSVDSKTHLDKPTVTKETSKKSHPVEVASTPQTVPPRNYHSRYQSNSQPQPVRQPVRSRVTQASVAAARPMDTKSNIVARAAPRIIASPGTLHSTPTNTRRDSPITSKVKEKEPMEQWLAMSQLGSYGGVEIPTNAVSAAHTVEQLQNNTSNTVASEKMTAITIPRAIPVASGLSKPVGIQESSTPRTAPTATKPREAVALQKSPSTPVAGVPEEISTPSTTSVTPSLSKPVSVPQAASTPSITPVTAGLSEPIVRQEPSFTPRTTASATGLNEPVPEKLPTPHTTSGVASLNEPVNSPEPLLAEEAAIITGVPVRRLTVGAAVSGKLVTPVAWADSKSNTIATKSPKSTTPTEGEKFIVELTEPLTGEDGSITLPQGTQIVAQVTHIQESGLIQLEATQIVIDGAEYVLPPGAIVIRGTSGQPLMASKWGDKGSEIASRDATTFAFGSLAKVGEVLNQPQSEQSAASSGLGGTTIISSTNRGKANILGAVLEGGFKPLTEQILERNEQALKEIQEREDVWYIPALTSVQVFINQSFEF